MEKNEIIQIHQADMISALNRSEVDIQISTAKQWPRHLPNVLNLIETYATMDTETAEDCFYALRRGGDTIIEGVSVRMAEIIASAWGNVRIQTRIIGNDGKTITAQGICHDLETNLAVSVEVKRRITGKDGRTFSEDMQVVTGNAASAIAFRNAVLKVVPKAVTKSVLNRVKEVAMGKSIDLETSRQNLIGYYAKIGVKKEEILSYLNIKSVDEIDKERVFELRALANAIKEGTTTVKESFAEHTAEAKKAKEAAQVAQTEAQKKIVDAIKDNGKK